MSAGHAIEVVKAIAAELATPADPDYKDDWERGYDAGREAAGRELIRALREEGFVQ